MVQMVANPGRPRVAALLLTGAWACSDVASNGAAPDAGPADAAPADAASNDAGGADAGSTDGRPDLGRSECDPLNPEVCALPWPSNLYLSGEVGVDEELAFITGSLPINGEDVAVDVERLQVHDGYSVDTPIVVQLPNVDTSTLPTALEIDRSLDDDAPILLFRRDGIDLIRVPYWVETDVAESDPAARLLFVRPAERLLPSTSYVVAFRNLVQTDGSPVPRSAAFQQLLDRDTQGSLLENRQDRFDELLSALFDEGVAPDELQLAWDFRTVSRRRLVFRLESMRQTYQQLRAETGPVRFTFTSTTIHEDDPNRFITLEGQMEVPWFLRPDEINGAPGEVLNTAGDPMPLPVGTRPVRFRIDIPPTASNDVRDPPRSTVVQVGHPIFSNLDLLASDEMARLATEQRLILVATDWPGLAGEDAPLHAAATGDLNLLQFVVDRIHQGFVNQWALTDAMRDYFSREYVLSVLNTVPEEVHYYGLDASAALGPALLATNPGLERGVLAAGFFDVVTGGGRSTLWSSYLRGPEDDLVDAYGSVADAWVGVLSAQLFYDYVMSSLYVGYLDGGAAPFAASRALFTGVKGDRVAPTIDLEVLARTSTYTVSWLENAPEGRDFSRLQAAPYPHAGSGVVMFDVGAPFPPPGVLVPEGSDPDPHDVLFELEAHQTLLRRFVETGVIEDVCGGEACVFGGE